MLLLLLIALILLINHWNQHKGIVFLVLGILISSIRLLTFLLINIQTDSEVLALIFLHTDPLMCLIGPTLLYYFKSLIFPKMVFKPLMLLHLLPAILVLINTLPFYSEPFADKVNFATYVVLDDTVDVDSFHPLLFSYKLQKVIPPIINISYFLFFLFYGPKLKREGNVYIKKKVSLVINRMMIILAFCIIPAVLLVAYSSYQASVQANEFTFAYANIAFKNNSYLYLFTLIMPISFFLSPSMLYGDSDSRNKLDRIYTDLKILLSSENGVGQRTIPKSDDLDRIIFFIEDSKPYLKDNFSLHDISRAINIPHVRVTNCFNKQLKISFPIYRNRLRVQYATSMLRDGAHLHMSIEGIAMKSGFKSISAFYMAFKAEYGVTPIEWIKENL
jgi:AraC-like DNA-binding protein